MESQPQNPENFHPCRCLKKKVLTCSSKEDSSLGNESINTSISFAVLAINLENTAA